MRGAEFTPDLLRILATRAPGSPCSMNTLRHDLTAASIPPICAGALLRWARDRGYLEWTGTEATDAGNPAARGRPIQSYARTAKPVVVQGVSSRDEVDCGSTTQTAPVVAASTASSGPGPDLRTVKES